MWARWSNTISDGTRSRIGMISMILAAEALIWMCHPSSFTRFESGSIISGVVAPIGRWRYDDIAAGADALLKSAVILDQRISRAQYRPGIDRILGIVDVVVAVTGISRRLQFRGFGAGRPFDLLCRGIARACGKQAGCSSSGHDFQQFAATPRRSRHDLLPILCPEPYHFHRSIVAFSAFCVTNDRRS